MLQYVTKYYRNFDKYYRNLTKIWRKITGMFPRKYYKID